jgi:hypothetical protein
MKTNQRNSASSAFVSGIALFVLTMLAVIFPPSARAQWNTNTSVNIEISGLPTADIQSVPTTDGKTWIAFYHENSGNYDMRAQLIDANGYKQLGPDGMLVSNYSSGSATFVFNVCVDAANNLIIGMQDQRSGNMQAVLYKISQAGAHLWGSTGIILGLGLAPYPCALSNGEVAVAWSGDAGNTLNLQKITTSGALAWTTPFQITVGTSATTRGQIIANSAGKFTMVYQKRGVGISTSLYAQMFDNAGVAQYTALQICNQTTSGSRYYSIAAEVDTTYFGYYSSSGNRFNSFLQRINPNGTTPWGMNGSNFNTSVGTGDNYQGLTSIGKAAGSNYVWSVCNFSNPNQTQYGVYIQKFLKTTGVRQFTDAGKVVYAVSASSDQQSGGLAVVYDTPMFMSYDNTEKIYATRLDANGNFMWPGNRLELSSTTAGGSIPKMRYGFTPDGPNRCAGVWTENRGTNYMGYAQGVSIGGLIGVTVATQGSVPATITTGGGTLQMVATVIPSTANQSVTWSIVAGTGAATISTGGLVTAVSNGTVYAKATAVQDITVKDSLLVTISGQASTIPSVTTLAATGLTLSGATLNGSVTANSAPTTVSFNWGLTTSYGNTVAAVPATVNGTTPTAVLANLTGLVAGTTYHFRATGTNTNGTTNGNDLTFTTTSAQPVVVTNSASNVGLNSAQMNGTVTANNAPTTVSFEYGLTTSYGSNTAATPATVNGTTATAVLANLTGLLTTTLYHYRCVGVNAAGTTNGADMTFTTGCQTPVAPGAITGAASVCPNQTGVVYSVPPVTNAISYNWTVPTGAAITAGTGTTSITVSYSASATSGNVTVAGANSCATGPTATMPVTVNASPVPAITGTATLCEGSGSYTYTTETGMTNYTWTVSSGGTIVSGGGTNAIQVQWNMTGSQTVSVNYSNANGCQAQNPTVYNVTVNSLPAQAGAITGAAAVCAGAQGVAYSVAPVTGAISYVWVLPAGTTIASGSGSNVITVDYAANAVSGDIYVMGNNLCGNGQASPSLAVVVNPIPPTPVVTVNGFLLTSSAPLGNQWYQDGNAITGATAQTYNATGSGWYATVVTLNGCSSDTSNHIHITVGMDEKTAARVNIYPVPNDGRFSLTITSASEITYKLEIFNSLGVKLSGDQYITVSGTRVIPVDLRPVPGGLYTLILRNAENLVERKFLVTK